MGLLDSVLGGVLGGALDQGREEAPRGGGMNAGLMAALLPIVLSALRGQPAGGGGGSGSGGLGDVLGSVLGGGRSAGGGVGGLGSVLGGMLGGHAAPAGGGDALGGLGALLNGFQQAGLGDQAASWISTGRNMPLSADDVGKVFGDDALAQIAQQAGVSRGDASAGLAELLPQVVDHLTPHGRMPEASQLDAGLDDLLRQLTRG